MSTTITPITDVFARWATTLSAEASPQLPDHHTPGCHTDGCERLRPAFPALEVAARCSGRTTLLAVDLSWTRAVRGRTRHLCRAMHEAWLLAVALDYGLCVSPEPIPAASELFDAHVIRLPMSPGDVTARADGLTALSRTVGALGWGLTDGRRAFPALAETVAGIASLLLLDLLGVEIRWPALGWDVSPARSVAAKDVDAARQTLNATTARLERLVAASVRPARGGSRPRY